MNKFKEVFNSTYGVILIMGTIGVIGFNLGNLTNTDQNVQDVSLYTYQDLSIALEKQVEKITSQPDDIKLSDLKGLNDICTYALNSDNIYFVEMMNFDSISINCEIIKDFYTGNI